MSDVATSNITMISTDNLKDVELQLAKAGISARFDTTGTVSIELPDAGAILILGSALSSVFPVRAHWMVTRALCRRTQIGTFVVFWNRDDLAVRDAGRGA